MEMTEAVPQAEDDEIDPRYAAGCSPERWAARQVREAEIAARPQTLSEMIARGGYDVVAPMITAGVFPVDPRHFTTDRLQVVKIETQMTHEELEAEFDRRNLRPAGLAELLALEAMRPAHHMPLSAPGSFHVYDDGGRSIPCVYNDKTDGRKLGLTWIGPGNRWAIGALFLTVQK